MFLKIARYGTDVVASVILLSIVLVFISFVINPLVIKLSLDIAALLLTAFTIFFFRDPDRIPDVADENVVLAPADGKVIYIGEVVEPEFRKAPSIMISIFMSPINVHVNRIPFSGVVTFLKYIKGEYLVAFDNKSSERNERMLIGIEKEGEKILFKQIAGFIARRIVCELKEGQQVTKGERFGMIKFGSRVDIFLSTACQLNVKVGDKTMAGRSVLGVYYND
ncbi:MAG: phosphatidylserine decarboxylase family protein [Candidatus Kryptoniota bacterium]